MIPKSLEAIHAEGKSNVSDLIGYSDITLKECAERFEH